MSRARPFSLLAVVLLASACGPVRYIPIEMLDARPAEDPAPRAGAIETELRIGGEWLEIRLHNPGPTPVRIDWGGASFTDNTGTAHFLLSSARLAQLYQHASMRQYFLHSEHGAFVPGSIAPGEPWLEHRMPSVLSRDTRENPFVLKAGESIREVLYPAEHARVGETGELWFSSLFCGQASGVRNRETFSVAVPVQREGQWEVVTLVARLR
jgi:hypothetical protein